MSITGIQSGLGPIGLPQERPAERPTDRPAAGVRTGSGGLPPASDAVGLGLEPATLPAEAPAGTDPALWSVLTTEERAFYARTQSLGPLTYRPGASNAAPHSIGRGGRVDVRA